MTKFFVIIAVVLLLFAFGKTLVEVYADWLWFTHDAKQPEVFAKTVRTQVILWSIGLVFAFLVIYLNAKIALNHESIFDSAPADENARAAANLLAVIAKFGRLLSFVAALVVGFGVASTLSASYRELWAFQAAVPFGKTDALFGLDIGFFVFKLPFYMTLFNVVVAVLIVAIIVVLLGYLGTRGLAKVAGIRLSQGPMRAHVSLLAGLTLIVFGARMFFSRYLIAVQQGDHFTGPGYAGSRVVAFYAIMGVAVAVVGLLAIVNAKAGKPWRALSYGVPVLMLLGLTLFGIVPGAIQQYQVEPNLLTLEPPYAMRAIESTRFAFGIDEFEVRDFNVRPEPTSEEVAEARNSLRSMRLWDPSVLQKVFDERQSLRNYYKFFDVDVDRYRINGEQRMVMLAPRDISNSGLEPRYQNWQNQHLRYTHGFGVVVVPANEAVDDGLPNYWLSNLPPVQGGLFPLEQQRIYFANYPAGTTERDGYVLLRTKIAEFDYPSEPEATHNWTGDRGIPISGGLAKFAFSLVFGEIKLYTTKDITDESRLVIHRDIVDRATKVYPFLRFDHDPYVVLDQGRVFWVLDAYTATSMVPYSEFWGDVNYIRNTVKIVLDAYSGDMQAFAMDAEEPILKAWMGVFPGLIRPNEEIPVGISEHLRYPEGLFAAQSEVMAQYHVTDPLKFLSNEDAWQVPLEIGRDGVQEPIEPYYVQMRIPGTAKDGFMLIRPFSPRTKNNMIGWMAAHCDPDDYGKVVLFKFPRDTQTQGPLQMESKFAADPIVADINRQFNNDQSSIVPGNLLVIPLGSSLLYVKPLFLQSTSRPIPELRKVVLGVQNRVVVGDTYSEALQKLFGTSPVDLGVGKTGNTPTPTTTEAQPGVPDRVERSDLQEQIAEVIRLLDQAEAAQRAGDWARYGELQQLAREQLRGLAK